MLIGKNDCLTDIWAEKLLYINEKRRRTTMKKRMAAMMMALMMAAGLAGCGSADEAVYEPDSTATSKKEDKDTVSTSKNKDNASMTLSEAIHDGEYTIWYSASEVDKDKEPTIFVLYDDGTCISGKKLDGEAYTFRELSEMSDEDIVSHVQSIWNKYKDKEATSTEKKANNEVISEFEKNFTGYYDYLSGDDSSVNEVIQRALCYLGDELWSFSYDYYFEGDYEISDEKLEEMNNGLSVRMMEESFEGMVGLEDFWLSIFQSDKESLWIWYYYDDQSYDDEFFQSVKEQYIAAARETCGSDLPELEAASANYDERGTYTITAETDSTGNNIESETINFSDVYGDVNYYSISKHITISSTLSPQTILESYYGGYSGDDGLFVMRTGSNTQFTLDTKDTEGITVD
jgi:hypothetical protein